MGYIDGMDNLEEYAFEEKQPTILFVQGPMFLSKTSVKYIENALRERVSSVYMQRQMIHTLTNVPVIRFPLKTIMPGISSVMKKENPCTHSRGCCWD